MQEAQFRSLGQEDILAEGAWQPTPVFSPEIRGQRSWGGYSPWGFQLDMTGSSRHLIWEDLDIVLCL